ncbi:MAG: hypothetical protein U0350_08290 [Caldilineaceae bacterium]
MSSTSVLPLIWVCSPKGAVSRALHRPLVVGLTTNAWPVRRTQSRSPIGTHPWVMRGAPGLWARNAPRLPLDQLFTRRLTVLAPSEEF